MKKNKILIFIFLSFFSLNLKAGEKIPDELQGIRIDEKIGAQVDLSLKFKDEQGKEVTLSNYFHDNKPVLLLLAYYGCPNLCNFFLNGVTDTLKTLKWLPGKEFEIVTVSIDPREKSDLALRKKKAHIKELGKPEAENGWHFLVESVDTQDPNFRGSAKILAEQVGFNYRYDKEQNQYAHSAAAIFLTPKGIVSRYLFGIQFLDRDFKLALGEASNGKIGNIVEQLILFCYNYDPKTKKYSLYVMNIVRVASVITVLILFFSILGVRRKNKIQTKEKENLKI
jgi:protein SCO1/2